VRARSRRIRINGKIAKIGTIGGKIEGSTIVGKAEECETVISAGEGDIGSSDGTGNTAKTP